MKKDMILRYNLWLKNVASTDIPSGASKLLIGDSIPSVSVLQKILKPPVSRPPLATAKSYQKTVLTSIYHRKLLVEEERLKNE